MGKAWGVRECTPVLSVQRLKQGFWPVWFNTKNTLKGEEKMENICSKFFYSCPCDYTSTVTGHSVKRGDIISETFRATFFPETSVSDFVFIGSCITTLPIGAEFTNKLRRLGQYPEIVPFKEYL